MRIEEKKPDTTQTTSRPVYESDLTKKEKRQLEKEKIKNLSGTKKLSYLWTYYKVWLLVPVLLAAAVYTGIQIWQNAQEKPLLYVNISDTDLDSDVGTARLSEDLRTLLGAETIHQTVPVTTSVLSTSDYEASMMMSVWLSTGEMDIILCDEKTYKDYEAQGVFLTPEALFSDDLPQVSEHLQNGILTLSPTKMQEYSIVSYTPICAGVLTTSKHQEAAKTALYYLMNLN